jgi:hypothetical protein
MKHIYQADLQQLETTSNLLDDSVLSHHLSFGCFSSLKNVVNMNSSKHYDD